MDKRLVIPLLRLLRLGVGLEADEGKYFAGNCSGGDVTFTLPSAATVGNGWFISIGHAGSANQVIVETV